VADKLYAMQLLYNLMCNLR